MEETEQMMERLVASIKKLDAKLDANKKEMQGHVEENIRA
jgi:hypothetical protein